MSASDTEPAAAEHNPTPDLSKQQIKRATRTRKFFGLLTSFFLLLSVIFLILVNVAGTSSSRLTSSYFLKIDLTNIVPLSVPNARLLNSIAQSIGLHDFYQVYLWGFCEGYNQQGVTFCSEPKTLFYFNPVEILRNELFAGASIQLPADINDILDLIRLVSNWMFGFFITGAVLSFILLFVVPLDIYSRWISLPISILTFLNAFIITVACAIATAMFVIFNKVIEGVAELNIEAEVGIMMFIFMWIAAAFAILTWLFHMGLCCCCASRRDVRSGRRKGSKKAYSPEVGVNTEKSRPAQRRFWKKDD